MKELKVILLVINLFLLNIVWRRDAIYLTPLVLLITAITMAI